MMETTRELIQELTGIAANPGAAVRDAMQQTGKKAVGCFPIYAPEELVYAAGMLPVGMWGGNTKGNLSGKYLQSFCCSIMKANTEQALRGDYDGLSAVIMTAYCDTLKCLMENWKVALPQMKILPVVYAQNRKSESGRQYMKEEFLRLKKELEAVSGTEITDEALEDALNVYDDYRSVMQEFIRIVPDYPALFSPKVRHLVIKAAYFMDKKVYTEKIRKLLGSLPAPETKPRSLHPVILTGLLGEPLEFLDLLEENGFQVVADDLAQESRQFRTVGDRSLPPLERMADRIARQDGCAFLYDEKKTRGAMLLEMAKETGAQAVIYCQLKFCDPEEFDYPILKKEFAAAKVPLLYVELEQQMDSLEQLRTRIQTLAEILPMRGR